MTGAYAYTPAIWPPLAGVIFVLMAPFMAAVQTTFQAATNREQRHRETLAEAQAQQMSLAVGDAEAAFAAESG